MVRMDGLVRKRVGKIDRRLDADNSDIVNGFI
jgi:hypothetical protein